MWRTPPESTFDVRAHKVWRREELELDRKLAQRADPTRRRNRPPTNRKPR